MKIIQKVITIIIFLVGSIISFPSLSDENKVIEWELDNPFRFFTNPEITKIMKKIYNDTDSNSYMSNKGLSFERLLQEKFYLVNEDKEKVRYPSLGWASLISINGYEDTCWNFYSALYDDSGLCRDYINPKIHKIHARIKGGKKGSVCNWNFEENGITNIEEDCSKSIPINIPYNVNGNAFILNVDDGDGVVSTEIKVKDLFVVGLGDSYGAGEGNPDIPVTFKQNRSNSDKIFVRNNIFPRKDLEEDGKTYKSAQWLDRRCHRSLYSYQFKTALQLAMSNPQQAITFVSFSCTGATTNNILDELKSAAEHKPVIDPKYFYTDFIWPNVENSRIHRSREVSPQIELLKKTLDKSDRKIDILLLSTGGNDIGFANYVMNVMAKNAITRITAKIPTQDTAHEISKIINKNYKLLDKEIKKFLVNNDPRRIFLTAYPNILRNERGELCNGDNEIFDIPFGRYDDSNVRKQQIRNTEANLLSPFYDVQKHVAKNLNWSFVDSHREKYLTRGFCANESSTNGNEGFIIPHKKIESDSWYPEFNYNDYMAYAKKQRWIQIPRDSMLMINRTNGTQRGFFGATDFLFSDETTGIMHPNADGLAVTANENYNFIIGSDIYSNSANKSN